MRINKVDVYRPGEKVEKIEGAADAREGDAIFTMRGNHDYMYDDIPATNRKENSGLACAKKVRGNFYIKMNDRQEIYDPLEESHVNTAGRVRGGLSTWRYVKVAYTTFAHYAHYLKTRNSTYLTLTRRDLGSGTI